MAFVPSYNSRLFVGPLAYSMWVKGFNFTDEAAQLDITTLMNSDGTPMVAPKFRYGLQSGTGSFDALLDDSGAATSQFIMANTWKSTAQVVTLAPAGTTRGNPVKLINANQSTATITSQLADVVGVNVSYMGSGPSDTGVVIDPETVITANTNGTSVDNGAATSNGGVGHLHVTAFSGFTSNSVILEHSTNNSVWTTLGTFTLTTGVTSERLVIAAGTTVNQYLRIRDAVTGTGSTTRIVSFSRR